MNKFYGNAIFCANCRMIITEDKILYECKQVRDLEDEQAHRINLNKALGKSESEMGSARGGFHYYFRRPPLRMFQKRDGNAICPVCKLSSSNMVCPKCFLPLTSTAKRTEAISVVGIKGCGKTVYIGALINEIKRFFSAHGVIVQVEKGLGENYILQGGQRLPGGTPSGEIKPVQLHFGREENGKYPFDLFIYDIAGEDLSKSGDDDKMHIFHHLSLSSLIIYLFDPLTYKYHSRDQAGWGKRWEIKEHAARCVSGTALSRSIDNDNIVDLIIKKIRENYQNDLHTNGMQSKRLPIYIAPCISSSDFLRWKKNAENGYNADADIDNPYYKAYRAIDFTEPASCITGAAIEELCAADKLWKKKINKWQEQGKCNIRVSDGADSPADISDKKIVEQIAEWMQLDSEQGIKATLRQWGENNTCLKFGGNFEDVAYFGLSSLMSTPKLKDGEFMCPDDYVSRNVINPLIWYFKREGILDDLLRLAL